MAPNNQILILLIAVVSTSAAVYPGNLFIGTGGDGYGCGAAPMGIQVPFGMVRVGPDTFPSDRLPLPWRYNGGYYYGDSMIRGFSHTHMVGAGLPDLGTIPVIPLNRIPQGHDVVGYNYATRFSHANESAVPGLYTVFLDDPQVGVEITARQWVGAHRYSFANNSNSRVVAFPISDALTELACAFANITVDPVNLLVYGQMLNMGGLSSRFGGFTSYFVAQFHAPFASFGVWKGPHIQINQTYIEGNFEVGGFVELADLGSSTYEFEVGLSAISVQQAMKNLRAQIGSNFDATYQLTAGEWSNLLGQFSAQGGSSEETAKWTTFLYRSFLTPTRFDEAGGVYVGFDKQVHLLPSGQEGYYTDMSIWDVYRTQFPWLAFVAPNVSRDIMRSLLLMAEQGGDLPRWPLLYGYTSCMVGSHAIIAITDAYLKGVQDFNQTGLYYYMKKAATQPQQYAGREDVQDYLSLGFVPVENSTHSACLTQAYAYDDYVLGTYAQALGFHADAQTFLARGKNYAKVWSPQDKFMCPTHRDGSFSCPSTMEKLNVFSQYYVEGDAWHYRFNAEHDIPGLISLFGGNKSFVSALEEFHSRSFLDPTEILPNPYYWAGNEEDLHTPYLFNWAGRPDLTQSYVRKNLAQRYTNDPAGIPGNDDYGTMSAWYLWSAIGIYPLAGTTTFVIGSPAFPSISIERPGLQFTMRAYNWSPTNVYVSKCLVNGVAVPIDNMFIDYSEIAQNGVIEFWMSNSPSTL